MPSGQSEGFSLDKRIPLALLLAILVQTATIAWWGASTEARVHALELSVDPTISPRVAVIEAKMDYAVSNTDRSYDLLRDMDSRLGHEANKPNRK
jgi:hypothetical protein